MSTHGPADGNYNFDVLVESSPDAILVQTGNLIQYANRACVALLGASSADQLVGMNIEAFLLPDHLPEVREMIAADLARGTASVPHEHVIVRLDGTQVAAEAHVVPISWNGRRSLEVVLRDISERKRAEQALKEREDRLRLAQDLAALGLWEWDFSSRRVICSQEMCRQFGCPGEQSDRDEQELLARVHPDDRELVDSARQAAITHGSSCSLQYRAIMPDGDQRWFDVRGVVVKGTTRMLGVAIDITDLKNTQASLQETQEKYRLLLDSTAEGIFGLDRDGVCTFCNPAAARMFGYNDPSELLGKCVHDLHHHTRPNGIAYPREQCPVCEGLDLETGIHVADEQFFRVDGTSFPCEYRSYPVRRMGKIVGSVVTFLDISEQRTAAAQLQSSEAKYRSMMEAAPYGIYRSTASGRFLMANPTLVRMLGYESEQELLDLDIPRDVYANAARRIAVLGQTAGRMEPSDFEVDWKRKDGSLITVRHSAVAVRDSRGHVEAFQAIVEDISERKSLQQQLWQAQKMEAVGRLAGGVAHDFNNVLMIVGSYADLILQSGIQDPKILRYAGEIEQASRRAASVTRQLLAFSRKQIGDPEIVDANAVISELRSILPKFLGEDIEVVIELGDSPLPVSTDRGQIEQIIMNLAANARDAMPKGGRFTITSGATEFGSNGAVMPSIAAGRYAMLTVEDTGMGMDSETRARVFEPFFTTKERGKGTGLGLATVYGIAKQSGGAVAVHSELGRGTKFELLLPLCINRECCERGTAHSGPIRKGSGTILVIEDEAGLRAATSEFLESVGYTVLRAGDGAEALRRCADTYPSTIDAILTDIVMPDIDGVELVKMLRSFQPDIRVIYMSGYSDREVDGLESGAVLLQKPFSLGILAAKLRALLDTQPEPLPPVSATAHLDGGDSRFTTTPELSGDLGTSATG